MAAGGFLSNWRGAGEAALWVAGVLLAGSAHVAAAAWLLQEEPAPVADGAPPAAIMIDLADVAQAEETEETDVAPDREDAPDSEAAREQAAPDQPSEPSEVAEPEESAPPEEPVEDPVEEEVPDPETEPETETTPVQEQAVVPLPAPRPPAPPKAQVKKQVQKKKKPTPQRASAASRAKMKARAKVRKSTRTAARRSSSGGASSISPARWQSRLQAHLERNKRYPSAARARREEGVPYVRFTIDGSGRVTSVRLARSSGYAALDQAVVAMVKRASPVPAPPPGVSHTLTVPVRFAIH